MASFEDKLDALASNMPSEADSPHTKGGNITELTSLPSISFVEKAQKPPPQSLKTESVGKSFSDSLEISGGQDKGKYRICVVRDLGLGDVSKLSRQRRSGRKNTFCLKQDCKTDHRNYHAPPIELDQNSIVILRSNEAAFVEPIGSLNYVNDDLLEEWKLMSLLLLAWSKLFMMSEMSELKVSKEDLLQLEAFEKDAAIHKTPAKTPKLQNKIDPFESRHDWKFWEKEVLGGKTSLNLSGSKFSEAVENQFKSIESAMREIVKQVNDNNFNLSRSVRMLEFEKNKVKRELGNRENIQLDQQFEFVSVWSTLSAMSNYLTEARLPSPPNIDEDFKSTLSSFVQTKFDQLDKAVTSKAVKRVVDQEIESLKRENVK